MKKFSAVLCGLGLLIAFNLAAKPERGPKVGKVSFFIGNAKIKMRHQKTWNAVKLRQTVREGDRIQTRKAERVEIKLKDGSILRIGEKSDVAISCPNADLIEPEVNKGRIWANIRKLGTRKYDFQVTSGTATAAIRGTVFRMNNDTTDSTTRVLVYDGKVEVGPGQELKKEIKEKPGPTEKQERREIQGPTEVPGPYEVSLMDWVAIVKGQQINVRPDGKYHKFKFNRMQDDMNEWVQFNKKRDAAIPIEH